MFTYKNKGRNSGVASFRSGNYYIKVLFKSGSFYLYSKKSAGYDTIRHMQRLARTGIGLNSFIVRRKPGFAYNNYRRI